MTNDFAIVISLISLGFFGGFTHCAGMCGPFVFTQITNRLEKVPLEKFSNLQKLKNLALLPYHSGRITTYCFIGTICSIFSKNIQDFSGFKFLSASLLFIASLFFLQIFFEKKFFNFTFIPKLIQKIELFGYMGFPTNVGRASLRARTLKLYSFDFLKLNEYKLSFAKNFQKKFQPILSNLFKNPEGFKGYFLGIILGFIPCGLLYGAFLLSAAISKPLLATCGMFLFGISTFPSLFLTACGGYFFSKSEPKKFKLIAKIVILINAIMLLALAINNF